ncbi:uncharacterized protein LOC111249662 isoform X2 [Varroa destructor]|uniref:Uncharacterized protein n=1 Tax=Varroa destructor TaxID=109461 RepID=A0A7M7K0A8_VARDE|nr:uncharacterized protein LOC111249662 isoform X2 [Varroa destructor]
MWDYMGRHLEWNLQPILQRQRSIAQHRGLKDFESLLIKRVSSKQTVSFHSLYWALMESLERPASSHMVDDCEHFTEYHKIHRPWAKFKAAALAMKVVKDLQAENAGMEKLPAEVAVRLPQLQVLVDRCSLRSTKCSLRRFQLERYRMLTKSYFKKLTDSKNKEAGYERRIEELKIEAEFLGHEESDLLKDIARIEEERKEEEATENRNSIVITALPGTALEWSASLDVFPPRNYSSIRPCTIRSSARFTPRNRTRFIFMTMWVGLYWLLCEFTCSEYASLQFGLLAVFTYMAYNEM